MLYRFTGSSGDGVTPESEVVFDHAGNMYGTSINGGQGCEFGCGVVYKLTPSGGGWTESVIYTFQDENDGDGPFSGLVLDDSGNLYGTTADGGDLACDAPYGCGTVFQLTPPGSGCDKEYPLYVPRRKRRTRTHCRANLRWFGPSLWCHRRRWRRWRRHGLYADPLTRKLDTNHTSQLHRSQWTVGQPGYGHLGLRHDTRRWRLSIGVGVQANPRKWRLDVHHPPASPAAATAESVEQCGVRRERQSLWHGVGGWLGMRSLWLRRRLEITPYEILRFNRR